MDIKRIDIAEFRRLASCRNPRRSRSSSRTMATATTRRAWRSEYSPAPDVEDIARPLIAKHHDHLADVRIEFVFRDKASKSHGRVVLGRARKISGLQAFLARRAQDGENTAGADFFVIEIAEDEWRQMKLPQRRALVDHELCHCVVDPDAAEPTLRMRGHDLEEFNQIVTRHGLWKDDVAEFAKTAQLALFEGKAAG